jgi:leucyl/phenylalanyl-tRNA--protein transferase
VPVYRIPRDHVFPRPELAEPEGLLGVGGDLDPDRVLLGYHLGIFPWYSQGDPILWWSPDPRMVLWTDEFHVPRSLGKIVRRGDYTVTADRAFSDVIEACARTKRPHQPGTWITSEMRDAYIALHAAGHAHSIEAWKDGTLVGGLYGVAVGRAFCGESMFARADDASKVAFVALVRQLQRWDVPLVDCQMHTAHLERFGAREIPRADYLAALSALRTEGRPPGPWTLDADLA